MKTNPESMLVLLAASYTLTSVLADVVCQQSESLVEKYSKTDVLFLIDSSSSMCPYSEAVSEGMSDFLTQMIEADVDVHYGVASFGGPPTVRQSFSVCACPTLTHPNSRMVILPGKC
jgi:hypothetical protein